MSDEENEDQYILLEELEGETEEDRVLHAAEQLDVIASELTGDQHMARVSLAHALGRALAAGEGQEPSSFYLEYAATVAKDLTAEAKKNSN